MRHVQVLSRLVLGPVAVAAFAALVLARYGVLVAVIGAYVALVAAESAVLWWGGYQLRAARRRLVALRLARRHRIR